MVVCDSGPWEDVFAVVEFKQEEFYTYNEKGSCNGVTLSAASAYSDSRGWVAVYKNGRLEVFEEGFIHEMYVGLRLNNFRVFSINSKDMLLKALEKSICSMNPGRLCVLAC